MLRIYNVVEGHEILIDDSVDWVQVMPQDYNEVDPHILIEMKGFNWMRHADTCKECGAFEADLGTPKHTWWLDWKGRSWPLILSGIGNQPGKNRLLWESSENFLGTRLKLKLDIRTQDDLLSDLNHLEQIEDYEGCHVVHGILTARALKQQ